MRKRSFLASFQTFLATSSARTTTGQGGAVSTGVDRAQVAKLDITAVSGTSPTLTVTVEESPNGSTGWTTHSSFTAATAVSNQIIDLKKRSQPFLRASWTIGGTTPSFTFSVQIANSTSALL